MTDYVETFRIQRVTIEDRADVEDRVIRELPLTIILNHRELVTLLCSPTNLDYLTLGFLASEGLINSKDEVKKITVDHRRGVVRVETKEEHKLAEETLFQRLITSGCGSAGAVYRSADIQNLGKVESQAKVSAPEVFRLVREFQHRSHIYRTTGGVHSAALVNNGEFIVFAEDIGRHNAVDKIFGECLVKGILTDGHLILTSGRISSEILLKAAKRKIPIIISISAPTSLGVRLAGDLGVTIVGFVRGKRMNVYSHAWRITE